MTSSPPQQLSGALARITQGKIPSATGSDFSVRKALATYKTSGENVKNHEAQFSNLVKTRLSQHQDEAHTLWVPLAEEFDRAGPDAVNEHLAAEKQGLVERVQTLLAQVEGSIDG